MSTTTVSTTASTTIDQAQAAEYASLPWVSVTPRCHFCATCTDQPEDNEAGFLVPISSAKGASPVWRPACYFHASGFWRGSDWRGPIYALRVAPYDGATGNMVDPDEALVAYAMRAENDYLGAQMRDTGGRCYGYAEEKMEGVQVPRDQTTPEAAGEAFFHRNLMRAVYNMFTSLAGAVEETRTNGLYERARKAVQNYRQSPMAPRK